MEENIIESTARLTIGMAIGLAWMAGCILLISWNKLHGRETYMHEIM